MSKPEYWEKPVTVTGNENASGGDAVKLPDNDEQAQHKAAAMLAYAAHGNSCQVCGAARAEFQLCQLGQQLYQNMRNVGAVD